MVHSVQPAATLVHGSSVYYREDSPESVSFPLEKQLRSLCPFPAWGGNLTVCSCWPQSTAELPACNWLWPIQGTGLALRTGNCSDGPWGNALCFMFSVSCFLCVKSQAVFEVGERWSLKLVSQLVFCVTSNSLNVTLSCAQSVTRGIKIYMLS